MTLDVIIPALNEEQSIGLVLKCLPAHLIRRIYVCDNGSTDQTATIATQCGATVIKEPKKGYGAACLKGLATIQLAENAPPPDLIAFLDGDFSDDPAQLPLLLDCLVQNNLDLVLGSRVLGNPEPGSLTLVQRFGNALSTWLIKYLYGYSFTDLGPFRVIRYTALMQLGMQDCNYGWTVEMQVKASKAKLNMMEVPVHYKKRIGKSKVSGTLRGIFGAGLKILFTIFKTYVKG